MTPVVLQSLPVTFVSFLANFVHKDCILQNARFKNYLAGAIRGKYCYYSCHSFMIDLLKRPKVHSCAESISEDSSAKYLRCGHCVVYPLTDLVTLPVLLGIMIFMDRVLILLFTSPGVNFVPPGIQQCRKAQSSALWKQRKDFSGLK